MLWKIEDVENFVEGLTPVQKKRWLEVANASFQNNIAAGVEVLESSSIATKEACRIAKNFNLASFLDGPLVNIRGMEIFRVGTWNGRKFEEEDVKRMASNFKDLKDQLIPKLKITHREKQETLAGLASFGDIVDIVAREERGSLRLFADIDFVPKKVAEWIRDRRFAERSIELRYGFKIEEKIYKDVITAVSLLGHEIPAVAGMSPIKLSKEDNELNTQELVGIHYSLDEGEEMEFEDSFARGEGKGQGGPLQGDGGAELCVCPNCGFEKEHERGTPCTEFSCPKCGTKLSGKGGDNMDLKEILGKIETLQNTIEGIVQKQKDAELKFKEEQNAEAKAKVQKELDKYKEELSGLQTMKQDYEKMKGSLETSTKENERLLLSLKQGKVESFLKDLKTSGKLLPAFEVEARTLLMQLSEETVLGKFSKLGEDGKTSETELSQFEAFQNLLNKLPKLVTFKENSPADKKGGGEMEKEIKVGEEVFKLGDTELEEATQKYMKEHQGVSYEEALVAVSASFHKEGKAQGLSEEE
jgi:hypothetical protein